MGPPGAADTASRRKTAGGATVSLLPGLRKRKPGLRGNPAGRGLGGEAAEPAPIPRQPENLEPPGGKSSFCRGVGKTRRVSGILWREPSRLRGERSEARPPCILRRGLSRLILLLLLLLPFGGACDQGGRFPGPISGISSGSWAQGGRFCRAGRPSLGGRISL